LLSIAIKLPFHARGPLYSALPQTTDKCIETRGFCSLTLPYRKTSPARFFQGRNVPAISRHISSQLLRPERPVAFRHYHVPAAWMLMPEAAVNEDHSSIFRKNDVRFARQVLDVQAVTKTSGMKKSPDTHLGHRVFPPNAGHHPAARCLVDYVRHRKQSLVEPGLLPTYVRQPRSATEVPAPQAGFQEPVASVSLHA
jgi:hypothetical protein